jgi:hypothetical protein
MVTSQTTFVCCVESGALETQTVRMIESLRRWGGKFSGAPVFAVTPRFGPPLTRKTLEAFERLQVNYLRFQPQNRYSWKGFLNKHYAMAAVEDLSLTECVGWLDSDLLIVDEPDQLVLQEGEDFVACSPDRRGATTGKDDPADFYWQEVCKIVGIDIDDLPWVTTELEKEKIRLYFNSGVFVYRRSTGFSKHHLEATLKLFDARIASHSTGIYFTQHILGMAVVQMGLKWRSLPHSHNYGIGSKTYEKWYDPEELRAAKIVHYHDSMWPWFWTTFTNCLRDTHPSVADWLVPLGPLKNDAPLQWRAAKKLLDYQRSQQQSKYASSCKVI